MLSIKTPWQSAQSMLNRDRSGDLIALVVALSITIAVIAFLPL